MMFRADVIYSYTKKNRKRKNREFGSQNAFSAKPPQLMD